MSVDGIQEIRVVDGRGRGRVKEREGDRERHEPIDLKSTLSQGKLCLHLK